MLEEPPWQVLPVIGCRSGSTLTSWHTSVNKSVLRSQMLLCQMIGNLPLGQDMVRSIEKVLPDTPLDGIWLDFQLYLKASASWNPLCVR